MKVKIGVSQRKQEELSNTLDELKDAKRKLIDKIKDEKKRRVSND